MQFSQVPTTGSKPKPDTISDARSQSSVEALMDLFDQASAGSQEAVDFNLNIRADRTLEQLHYLRVQPSLTDTNLSTDLDNSTPEFLEYMKNKVDDVFKDTSPQLVNPEVVKIKDFINKLLV